MARKVLLTALLISGAMVALAQSSQGPTKVVGTLEVTGQSTFGNVLYAPLIAASSGHTYCLQIDSTGNITNTGAVCGGGGSGSVTNFAAPSASWPSWLVPTVTSPTTTPSLAVSASAVPNSALANSSTTVNGQTCTLGSTCTATAAPSGTASGDLSGTYPSPTVTKVNGASIPASASIVGTNSSHQFIDASTTFLAASPVLSTGYDDLSVTGYIPFSGGETALSAAEAPEQSLSPVNCSVNNLRVLLTSGDQGNLTTVTVSLRQNGSSSALTCTITGNGSTGNNCVDLAHSPSIVAGDKIDWQIAVSSGLTITGNVAVSATWQCVI